MKKVFLTFLVVLFATVVFGQNTRTEIKPSQLPQCVKDWVAKNLPSSTIDKAYRIDSKSHTGAAIVVSYIARTTEKKKNTHQWLQSDPNCKEVKKITEREAEPPAKQ